MGSRLKLDSTYPDCLLEGFFLPEVITRLFVILGFGRKIFGISLNVFRQLSKLQFMCPQITFVGKILFHQYRILSQNFLALFLTSSRRFSKLHLMRPTEDFEENYLFFWKTKTFFVFFWFFFPNFSKNLFKQHSNCPEYRLEGKNDFLKKPHICSSILRFEADQFWTFGKLFRWDCQNCFLFVQRNVL